MNTAIRLDLLVGRRNLLLVLSLVAMAACSRQPDYMAVFQDVKNLEPRAKVVCGNVIVGQVIGVDKQADGTTQVSIKVAKPYQSFIREKTVFFIHSEKSGSKTQSYLRLNVLEGAGPLLPRGSVVRGAETELDTNEPAFVTNWKVTVVIGLLGLAAMAGLIRAFRKNLKGVLLFPTLGACLVLAAWLDNPLSQVLADFVPFEWRPDLLAFVLLLLATYVIAGVMMVMIMRPFFQIPRRGARAKTIPGRRAV
ncbi:MAG: MlaD family protein [Candidatus Sumerlaeota bacterium]|nr:MlaD family protein [Candidatus Sumerlaeota bacterium]